MLAAPGPAGAVLLRYVSLYFDFISARHRYAALYQQLMTARGRPLERLVRKYLVPRTTAFKSCSSAACAPASSAAPTPATRRISIVGLIVFYFSAAPVLQVLGHADAYTAANLERRKQEVLDFIRHGLFVDPEAASS